MQLQAITLVGWPRFHGLLVLSLAVVLGATVSARAERLKFDVVQLGRAPIAGSISKYTADGKFTLTGGGRDASDACFEGAFAGVRTQASNFTFICRVAKAPTGTRDPQYGVMMRAGLKGPEKQLNLRYDGRASHRAWRWLMKYHVTPSSHDGSSRAYVYSYDKSISATEGIWLKVVRRYPFVYLYTSMDGKTWTEFGADYLKVMLPQKVWVGPQITGGADGKTPNSITFDRLSFAFDEGNATAPTADFWKEYHPPLEPYVAYFAKVETGTAKGPFSAYVQMPKDMNPKDIRGLVWTTGCKEMIVNGGEAMPWTHQDGLRKPADMTQWEGAYAMPKTRAFNQILAHYGLVRLGGAFPVECYPQAIERLAKVSPIKHLRNIPFCATGASAAGGASAKAANLYHEHCAAAAPTLIGMAGAATADRAVLTTPHLHVFGSKDGGHLKDVESWIPRLRESRALWAPTPMWRVYHRQHKSYAIVFPYFIETLRFRVPGNADYTRGAPKLKTLDIQSGWYGLADTWYTNYPEVVPVRGHKGDSKNFVWLPSELTARVWQAFVSQNPRTVIHFPMFEGHNNYGQPNPHGWRNSCLAADEPFELVASGPLSDDLNVEYYAGLTKLKVLKEHSTPYRVTLAAPEPGLHAVYAITQWEGHREISRPVTIMFQKRR